MSAPYATPPTPGTPARLGQTLIAAGLLDEDRLRIALHEQGRQHRPLGRLLVGLGFIAESALRQALADRLGLPGVDLAGVAIAPETLALLPRALAKRSRVLPLAYDATRRRLTLACADAHDLAGLERVRRHLGDAVAIDLQLAGESEIDRAIDQHYGHPLAIDGILHELATGQAEASHDADTRPVVRMIDAILADATRAAASDIHFEPEAGFLRIRYRIDGLLQPVRALHAAYWPAMAVRLKVLAGMNIAETRAPQDGRISLTLAGRSIDFRVASQPTLHGENIVLRLLDRQRGIVPLAGLGLAADHLQQLKRMIARPEGVILITGPTGSGKTTTLYSLLAHISHEAIHIMTLEDPVEYPMPLLRQTSVGEATRLDFANGIRSMMRQDPDVILVGEIRDGETATMAFRAAMTGHQVYSTLHTASALGVLPRLRDIGVGSDLLAGNIIGIVAQRLLRRLCPHCRITAPADAAECRLLALPAAPAPLLYRPGGCPHCDFRGYRGRLAIMEILRIDAELDELIARGASLPELRSAATARGFRPLAADGVRQVLAGVTSLAELARVVDLSERMD